MKVWLLKIIGHKFWNFLFGVKNKEGMRGKEGCTENGIVPIEDNAGLMSLRLVSWGNPYFFVSKFAKSVSSMFINVFY